MKNLLLAFFIVLAASRANGRVMVTPTGITVEGVIEGSATIPRNLGETLDYLTFEVTHTNSVRLMGTDLSGGTFLALAELWPNQQFHYIGDPTFVFYPRDYEPPPPPELMRVLDPGIYVVQVAVEEYRGGDLGTTFVPAYDSDGILSTASYQFALEGPVRGLQFLEGNLDGTFTVTDIPEPSATALLCTLLGIRLASRRRPRGRHCVAARALL